MLPSRNKALIFLIWLGCIPAIASGDHARPGCGWAHAPTFEAGFLPEAAFSSLAMVNEEEPPPAPEDTSTSDTASRADSIILEPTFYRPGLDTGLVAAYRNRTSKKREGPSPTLTMFKSVLVPGWGQVANGKYVKAGVVFVVESYFIYKWIYYAGKASDWRNKWQSASPGLKGTYFVKYADYRDTRNSFVWYTGLTVFISMFDAYVDAHLQDFPKDIPTQAGLSLDIGSNERPGLTLKYRF